jgi:hypothetical protein
MLTLAVVAFTAVTISVGSATAATPPLTVSAGTTSATVTGSVPSSVECGFVEVWDFATDGSVYDQFFDLSSGPFSQVFTGLAPGTEYNVGVFDDCGDYAQQTTFTTSAAATPWLGTGPDRYIFCAISGNTALDGTAIPPGTSLNLTADQVLNDTHYKGATPGFFVKGEGATCSLTPAQAALAATSTMKVNHTGGSGDYNQPEIYTLVG